MPNQTEPNANNALGDLLRSMMPGSSVWNAKPHITIIRKNSQRMRSRGLLTR